MYIIWKVCSWHTHTFTEVLQASRINPNSYQADYRQLNKRVGSIRSISGSAWFNSRPRGAPQARRVFVASLNVWRLFEDIFRY